MRKRANMWKVSDALDEVMSRMGLAAKLREHKAGILWPEIVGEMIAEATEVTAVRDGVLYVNCRSSTWANELLLHREEILKRIANRLGEGAIREIRFSGRGVAAHRKEEKQREEATCQSSLEPDEAEEIERIAGAADDAELAEVIRRALSSARRRR